MRLLLRLFASAVLLMLFPLLTSQNYNVVRIGMCTDVHLPTMHDSEYRITTFIENMKDEKPDFIIEMGDFGTPEMKYSHLFDIWNSFPGDRYHVIGNHEMDGGYTLGQALDNLKMTRSYYSFDKNGFHFIVLDGNDRKSSETKGYKRFIGEEQVSWLKDDLTKTKHPVVIFSHQPLAYYKGPDEVYSIENHLQIQKIFEEHNSAKPSAKVVACFNGHTHTDYAENVNDIWYITITSMSYHWLGEKYEAIRYSDDVDKDFKWIKFTAPFKEPLFTVVEISSAGFIRISGKKTEWVGPSPWDIGYPVEYKKYMRPEISERNLKFKVEK